MERIKLTKEEKQVFLHVAKYGDKQPKCISPATFHYCLATLQEKGLVKYKSNYNEILETGLTVKGAMYLEQYPRLRNPIDWERIILAIASVSLTLAIVALLIVGFKHLFN